MNIQIIIQVSANVVRTLQQKEPPVATPDFTPEQIYLNASPAGIDAHYAWTKSGGRGAGVKIIDCEWGWNFTHKDLLQSSMGTVVGTSLSYSSDPTANNSANRSVNHGTTVVGGIGADRNSFGVTGICPDANVGAACFGNSAQTIRQAADKLAQGDIILLEIHRPGPRHNFQSRNDQLGYIVIEWMYLLRMKYLRKILKRISVLQLIRPLWNYRVQNRLT